MLAIGTKPAQDNLPTFTHLSWIYLTYILTVMLGVWVIPVVHLYASRIVVYRHIFRTSYCKLNTYRAPPPPAYTDINLHTT